MKKTILLLSFVTCVTSISAEGLQSQEMPVNEMQKQNRQIVKLASEEITKTLPQKVDTYTTLQRVEGEGNRLTYVFEINTGAKSDEAVIKEDRSRMKKAVTSGICHSSKRFLDAQIDITYLYTSAVSKVKLFQFDVSQKDCFQANR
jgi:hypothetical protein